MKVFSFEGIDERLELVPMSARRALDAIEKKLSLKGFLSLSHESRRALALAGQGDRVDQKAAETAIVGADPTPTRLDAAPEQDPSVVPPVVHETLGKGRPVTSERWSALSALERYALVKVCNKPREPRLGQAYEEIIGQSGVSTHVRPGGGVHMVSVAHKEPTERRATAESWVTLGEEAFERLSRATAPKGDVLATARLAGIMATKRTADLIPLCHPLALAHAEIDIELFSGEKKARIVCHVTVHARTGVEMEAMVGASTAALTIYDMLKSLDRGMSVGPTQLVSKTGGTKGDYQR